MTDIDFPEDGKISMGRCSKSEHTTTAEDDREMEEGTFAQDSRQSKCVQKMVSSTNSEINRMHGDKRSDKGNIPILDSSLLSRFPLKISSHFMIDNEVPPSSAPNRAKTDLDLCDNQSSVNDKKDDRQIDLVIDDTDDGSIPEVGHRNDTNNTDISQEDLVSQSLSQLIATLQKSQQASGTVCDTHQECAAIERRVRDFEKARFMRFKSAQTTPLVGIMGLFHHLAGVRADLKWAEYAAYRRSTNQPYAGWTDYMKEHEQNYHHRPYFINFLFLASTVMMFYTMYLSDWKFAPLKVNPMVGPSREALIAAGALNTSMVVVHGEWYRLFSPLVLHAGILHYIVNMVAIWFIGRPLEELLGFANISFLFIISGVGGNILSAVFQPFAFSVGASGGIFGLLGVCLAEITVNWDLLFLDIDGELKKRSSCHNVLVLLGLFFEMATHILIGLTPYIDNFAHVGGMVYGILYALPLANKLDLHFFGRKSACNRMTTCSLRLLGVFAGLGLLVASSILLTQSDGIKSPCESCRFVSCAPFPFWKEDKWWTCS